MMGALVRLRCSSKNIENFQGDLRRETDREDQGAHNNMHEGQHALRAQQVKTARITADSAVLWERCKLANMVQLRRSTKLAERARTQPGKLLLRG